ncbi:MAG: hypothetical protein IJW16_07675 [Clostridia bacterium]|nr:hypothetical protein [Clostridia bacterium]
MKRLKDEQLNEQEKNDKLTEKAFTNSIFVSILSILLCMVCLSAVTWAWFNGSVSSAPNTIETQSYVLTMQLRDSNLISVDLGTPNAKGQYNLALKSGEQYTVILTAEGTGKNGYCKITVGEKSYYTNLVTIQNGVDTVSTFQFKLDNTSEPTVNVSFDLHWGTYSGIPHIEAPGEYVIDVTQNEISRVVVATSEPETE